MNAPDVAVPRAQYLKEIWLISAGHALTHWYPATFYVLLPLIGKELGLSYTQIGIVIGVQHIVGAIANLPGGMVVDAYGKKGHLLALALVWVGVPYALMTVTDSYWMLLVCVGLVGIGNNIWHPAAIPMLAHRYPDRKGLVLSFHGMGGSIGDAAAPLVIGGLLLWFSWRTVVVINVIPGIVMGALILFLLGTLAANRDGSRGTAAGAVPWSARQYVRDLGGLLRNRALMLVSISAMFRTLTQVGLFTFLPVFLAYEMGYSPFVAGLCLTVIQVAGLAAGPVGGHLSDKVGRRRVVMASMVLTGVMIVGMMLAGRTPMFVVFVALVGFFLYAMRPVLQAWGVESTPRELAGTGVGLQFGIQSLGGGIAPAVFGLIADTADIYAAFYAIAGVIVAANFLVFFVPRNAHEQRAQAARGA